jgi:hypothetical protein
MPCSTPDTISSLAFRLLPLVLLAGLAGSCGVPPDKFAPACPAISFLNEAADLTRFRPGGQDVTDMILDGKLTSVQGNCAAGAKDKPTDPDTVVTTMKVGIDLTRGPAARDRVATVTFFVAATEAGRVLDEQDYRLGATFPANIGRGTFASQDIVLKFPVSKQKSAAAYHVYVGFRLTPDELAYNRKRGAR